MPEWENEAKRDQRILEQIYSSDVHIISVKNGEELSDYWNNMGIEKGETVSIDTVVINTHANPVALGFGKSKAESFKTDDILNLNNKNIKNLILYGCNAGHLDYQGSNVASSFSKVVNSAPVLASDGTVSSRSLFGNYKSKNDKYFKDYCANNRKNQGWIVYRDSQVIASFGKKMNVKAMVDKLKFSCFVSSKKRNK